MLNRTESRHVLVNGVRLHLLEAGTGPLVLLLHGFPEFSYSWHHQLPALAAAGFHAVAPDLRGYNLSAKPSEVRDYRLRQLVQDVVGLIRAHGAERATIVGHDWGGVIAWKFAMLHPELLDRLAILNAPHPFAMARALHRPRQWLRSWYILYFQLPWLPEFMLSQHRCGFLKRVLTHEPVRPDAFSAEDIRLYREALSRRGSLTAALNYYRALLRYPADMRRGYRPVTAPTLLLWGERDPYLGIDMTEGLTKWVPHLRIARLANASHWVQNDAPDEVNRLLLEFLSQGA